jgi:inhibitor of KinA sporulation pathway (predicted exonuclease)
LYNIKRRRIIMSRKRVDKIVVVDIEATCWEGKAPENQKNEIIEVGICTLDVSTYQIEDVDGIIIKPKYSKVSEFCTSLTGLTQEIVDKGCSFQEACKILRSKYRTKLRAWGSWGDVCLPNPILHNS